MQSCSIHHCVLLLLTLTFTTAPVAAGDCPIQAKFHQPVTLPCTVDCSGEAKWTLKSTRSVFALCDQTSCSSVEKGYEMSHDQYLKGDLSLTITSAEYSMRNTYVCDCRSIDYSVWRLSIETVFSAVQKNPGGDLILDLTVPEPVEVIYTSSDSADGEQICTVTQHSLQCKAEYTHRTSLRYPELTLRDVMYSDSGRYTIRDTENKEDIRVYAVSVTGLTEGMIAGIVVSVLLVLVLITGVIIYKWREAEKKRRAAEQMRRVAEQMRRVAEVEEDRKVENDKMALQEKINNLETGQFDQIEQKIVEVEKMIDDLEKRYRENRKYSEHVTLFCNSKRRDVEFCRSVYETQKDSLLSVSEQDVGVSTEQLKKVMKIMEKIGNDLKTLSHFRFFKSSEYACEFLVTRVQTRLENIKSWCKRKREHLDIFKENHSDEGSVKLMIDNMKALLSVYEKWCEEKEEELQQYKPDSTEHSENQ